MRANANQAFSLQPSPIFNLGKGFQQELQAPPWCLSARSAMRVLTLILHPKTPLTPRPPQVSACCTLFLLPKQTEIPHLCGKVDHTTSHPASQEPFQVALPPTEPQVPLPARVCTPGMPPSALRVKAPCLDMRVYLDSVNLSLHINLINMKAHLHEMFKIPHQPLENMQEY